jgi:hypothetical protein
LTEACKLIYVFIMRELPTSWHDEHQLHLEPNIISADEFWTRALSHGNNVLYQRRAKELAIRLQAAEVPFSDISPPPDHLDLARVVHHMRQLEAGRYPDRASPFTYTTWNILTCVNNETLTEAQLPAQEVVTWSKSTHPHLDSPDFHRRSRAVTDIKASYAEFEPGWRPRRWRY